VYSVEIGTAAHVASNPSARTAHLSVVVLPFVNLSGGPAKDYVADVITEELTANLSRIAGSFVIARSTAFTYKGKPIDVRQLGRDLGVRYALEGSAQLVGSLVRVRAQLIDAESGAHLWTDQFNANIANLLNMQDEIVKRLAVPLELRLIDVDAARVARTPPGDLSAQDLALQCMAGVIPSFMIEGYNPAFGFCERAVQMDDRNAIALTFLSLKYITPVLHMQSADPQADIQQAERFAARALTADRNFYWAHLARAAVLISQKRHEEAIVELEQTLAINPGFTTAYALLCEANNYLGRPERGLEYVDKAIHLSPRDPLRYWFYAEKAWALLMEQQDDRAIEMVASDAGAHPRTPACHAGTADLSACTYGARRGSPRSAEAVPLRQRYHQQNHRSVQTPASSSVGQSEMAGLFRSACGGSSQGWHGGGLTAIDNVCLLCHLLQQRLCLFQIARVEAFGKPAVDRSGKIAGLIPLTLIAPEPRHLAFCRLATASAMIAPLCGHLIVYHAQKVAPHPMHLGVVMAFVGCLN
jgi:TolB-like protein